MMKIFNIGIEKINVFNNFWNIPGKLRKIKIIQHEFMTSFDAM